MKMNADKASDYLMQFTLAGARACTDSRMAKPGDIFFAIRGDLFDGNKFAADAIAAGCQLAVVDLPESYAGDGFLLVDDVLSTLQQLSLKYRKTFQIPVVGITGSNGKTTTKELCHAVLSSGLDTCSTSGNLNNHIGVPLTLLSFRQPIDVAVVEMGANHLKEIEFLCSLSRPDYGIITNIGKAHLEGFGGFENVVQAKSELYQYVRQTNGTLFVNGDDELLLRQSNSTQRILYGHKPDNHCSGKIISSDPFLSISFMVQHPFGKATAGLSGMIETKLAGTYNFGNVMAAITIGLYFGIPPESIKQAIEAYLPTNHRSQLIRTNTNMVLMDAYNANPTSMDAAIRNFMSFRSKGMTALFLGEMLELGNVSREEHMHIANLAISGGFEMIFFVGQAFTGLVPVNETVRTFGDADELARWLLDHPMNGYHILIKGSRGIKMEKLLEHL